MDHDRLRAWLELPPGRWPPDHYALLGLPRGAGAFPDIESRVLDRMERIRPHQLLHPELVTEGMNRLAQALVCLTDPVARAAYDRELGLPDPPFEVVESDPLPPAGAPPGATQVIELPKEVPFEPGLLPPGEPPQPVTEVVWEPAAEIEYYDLASAEEANEPLPLPAERERRPESEADAEPAPAPPVAGNLRACYRRLAAVRAALRAWDQLRPVFGNPAEQLATPVAVLQFLRTLATARAALPEVADLLDAGAPGGAVAAVVRHPHVLHLVRTLIPAQRQKLALDWRRGHEALARERARVRAATRRSRPRRARGLALRAGRELARTPEWILVLIATVVLIVILRRNW